MKINTTIVSFPDVGRLLAALEACGVTPPRELSDVLHAHEKLTAANTHRQPA